MAQKKVFIPISTNRLASPKMIKVTNGLKTYWKLCKTKNDWLLDDACYELLRHIDTTSKYFSVFKKVVKDLGQMFLPCLDAKTLAAFTTTSNLTYMHV